MGLTEDEKIKEVENIVGNFFDMHPNCIRSNYRTGEIAIVREVFCYVAFYKFGISLLSLAVHINKTETSVRNYISFVRSQIGVGKENIYAKSVTEITKQNTL